MLRALLPLLFTTGLLFAQCIALCIILHDTSLLPCNTSSHGDCRAGQRSETGPVSEGHGCPERASELQTQYVPHINRTERPREVHFWPGDNCIRSSRPSPDTPKIGGNQASPDLCLEGGGPVRERPWSRCEFF